MRWSPDNVILVDPVSIVVAGDVIVVSVVVVVVI